MPARVTATRVPPAAGTVRVVVTSGHTRDATRQLVQVRGHPAQFLRGTLQLAKGRSLFARALCHLFGALTVMVGERGDASHAVAQVSECELLLAGGQGDALRSRRGTGRGVDDEVERFARLLR